MRASRVLLILAVALAAACSACGAALEPSAGARPYSADLASHSGRALLQQGWQAELLGLVNDARAQAGAGPLCLNAKLSNAAQVGRTALGCLRPARPRAEPLTPDPPSALPLQRHSDDQAAGGFMSHTGSDGSDIGGRASDAGYEWNAVAENVANGQGTVQEVFEDW